MGFLTGRTVRELWFLGHDASEAGPEGSARTAERSRGVPDTAGRRWTPPNGRGPSSPGRPGGKAGVTGTNIQQGLAALAAAAGPDPLRAALDALEAAVSTHGEGFPRVFADVTQYYLT
jgi:hypothetical protein